MNRAHTIVACVKVANPTLIVKSQQWSSETIAQCDGAGILPIFRDIQQCAATLGRRDRIYVSENECAALIEFRITVTSSQVPRILGHVAAGSEKILYF